MRPRTTFVSSKLRINKNDTASKFTVNLSQSDRKVAAYAAARIRIPHAFHNVNEDSNTLLITENSVDKTITIPKGFYTPTTLAAELEEQLGVSYTVSTDDDTRAFLVQYSGAGVSIIKGGTILDVLGMVVNDSSPWSTATSQGRVWDLSGPSSVFICIAGIGVKGTVSHEEPAMQDMPIIARVPIMVQPGDMIYQNEDLHDWNFHWLKIPASLPSSITVCLQDMNGKVVDLNGLDWEFDFVAMLDKQ